MPDPEVKKSETATYLDKQLAILISVKDTWWKTLYSNSVTMTLAALPIMALEMLPLKKTLGGGTGAKIYNYWIEGQKNFIYTLFSSAVLTNAK